MKNGFGSLIYVLLGFVLCFLLMRGCTPDNVIVEYEDRIVYVPEIDTIIETETVTEYLTDTLLNDVVVHDTVIQLITENISEKDLAKIAKLFYDINFYGDTLFIDSLGFIAISDSIQRNRIKSRDIHYSIKFPVAECAKSGFLSAHAMVGAIEKDLEMGIGISYTTKKRWTVGYTHGIINNSHFVTVGKSLWNR